MGKLVLLSFADKRYRNALKRLKEYSVLFPFDERYFLTEATALPAEYWKNLKPWLYRRGYGYWAWKASIIKNHMSRLEDGDIILWADAGVYLNSTQKALARFNEYIELLHGGKDLLVFQQPTIEREWTKGDVFEALGTYDDKAITDSFQIWAGCFFIKKTDSSMRFVDKWIELDDIAKELITDKCSAKPNLKGFIEHRHDQSVFSVMVKRYPHVEISYKEVQVTDGNWELLADYPIQGRRHKEVDRPVSEVIKNKLLRPWRMCLFFYFTKIRHYTFLGGQYSW